MAFDVTLIVFFIGKISVREVDVLSIGYWQISVSQR